nr:MAG TPA: DNA polymerase II small subunit [Caudoviricetes sp.]
MSKLRMKEAYLNEQGVRISTVTGKPVRKYTKTSPIWGEKTVPTAQEQPQQPEVAQQPEVVIDPIISELQSLYTEEEIKGIINLKKDAAPVELIEIKDKTKGLEKEGNTGFLVASDWHVEETVKASTVLGKNEFNLEIAEKRVTNFFANSVYMIRKKPVDNLVIGLLGDFIGGFIHEELMQTNGLTPMEGIAFVKKMLISGLKYIHDELPELKKIIVVGICGNHARVSKRMQFANGFAMNMEYFLYKDIEQTLTMMGLTKFEYVIPESEFAYLDIYGKKILFCHGHQFRSAGGVGGIYPSMLRWFGKMNQTITIDKAIIGHWHQSIYTKEVCVNGSLKGFDAFALGNGLAYEEPKQTYFILNEKRGFIFYTNIFVD